METFKAETFTCSLFDINDYSYSLQLGNNNVIVLTLYSYSEKSLLRRQMLIAQIKSPTTKLQSSDMY